MPTREQWSAVGLPIISLTESMKARCVGQDQGRSKRALYPRRPYGQLQAHASGEPDRPRLGAGNHRFRADGPFRSVYARYPPPAL